MCSINGLIYASHFGPSFEGKGCEVSLRSPVQKTRDVDTSGVLGRCTEVTYGS